MCHRKSVRKAKVAEVSLLFIKYLVMRQAKIKSWEWRFWVIKHLIRQIDPEIIWPVNQTRHK